MMIKKYLIFPIRRHRHYLFRIIVLIISVCLFFQIRHSFTNYSPHTSPSINVSVNENVVLKETILNCSGDPLKQWCRKEVKLCDSYLVVYNSLFVVTRLAILQPEFAKGKLIGGENIQDVLNQPEQDEYFQFEKQFIKLPCILSKLNRIHPHGYISDILFSITTYETQSNVQLINETTIAVRRQDYVNFYHTITDLYTVYLLCRFFQKDPKSVRILFLDAHPKGNLDILWSQLFHSFTRLGHLKNVSSIVYRELIFSQPQPASEIDVEKSRREAPSFFFDFREYTLKQFNTNYQINPQLNCQSLNIFFLVRHNYVAHPRNPTGKIQRQLSNEKQILDELKLKFSNSRNINFSSNHFEELSIEQQLNTILQTDLFVGMHGAGLTHVIFLKSNRALVELVLNSQTRVHFDLMSSMNNVHYRHCTIENETSKTVQRIFYCITENISKMCSSVTTSTNTAQIVQTNSTFIGNVSNNTIKS